MTATDPNVTASPPPADPRAARATIRPMAFALLAAQLAGLLLIFEYFNVGDSGFRRFALVCFAGFVLHAILPFRLKKQGFIAISLLGGYLILNDPGVQPIRLPMLAVTGLCVALALAFGLLVYYALRMRVAFWIRLLPILAVTVLMMIAAVHWWLPPRVWQVIGAIFMFRTIIYAYDVRTARAPESLTDFLCYFFLLPNFYFLLFPVIDYTTFKRGWYATDIHANAQRGIAWIARGTVHLCLYRLVYHEVLISPEEVDSFWMACRYVFPAWWLYLEVSGKFHIIIGCMHLFGWQLPETNRLYFLSSSFTDFWRRINIYWKDFMVKVIYYPTWFRFRRRNETLATTLAVAAVFITTAILHGWQLFWIQGFFGMTVEDVIFWGVLAVLVWCNVMLESKRRPGTASAAKPSLVRRIGSTLAVYVTISILWSMWSSQDVMGWLRILAWWR